MSSTRLDASAKQRTIFLSIDIESSPRNNRISEVGVAILDTAHLSNPDAIQSRNFYTRPRHWCKPLKPFLFGTTENVFSSEVKDLFQRITLGSRHSNPLYESEGVQVVLVGHDIRVDMKIMEDCVPGIWENTVISVVIDLQALTGILKLRTVLDLLLIGNGEYRGWHCGGNDANYSLRALLLTCVRHVEANKEKYGVDERRIELVEQAVRSCVPRLPENAPQTERKRKQWDNVKDVEESLDVLGVGWSDLIYK